MSSPRRGKSTGTTWAGAATAESGRVVVLPGVYNTRFHLQRFVRAVRERYPGFDADIRTWGALWRPVHNVRAYARNLTTARRIAEDLERWRRDHPHRRLYVVGYSGGGGLAVLAVASLSERVAVDRLVLIAPAISPAYPLGERVFPRVREFVVNYASEKDLQVGWGTLVFGTMDRVKTKSAGAVGFAVTHPKLIEWRWSKVADRHGHRGHHTGYLGARWQTGALLPALDPAVDAHALAAKWTELPHECGRRKPEAGA